MKFNIALAAMLYAGLGACTELLEGPTMVDLDDDVVVTMIDGSLVSTNALIHKKHKKRHHHKRH